MWYDEREATANCVKGSTTVPCYRMYARKSTDNGVTWGPTWRSRTLSPRFPVSLTQASSAEYAGDYDYSSGSATLAPPSWTDGRVAINNASQQDAFFDQEGGGSGGGITLYGDRGTEEWSITC